MKNFIKDLRREVKKKHDKEKRIDGFHPSGLGSPYNCTRRYIIGYLCKKHNIDIVSKKLDPTKLLIFATGHALHDIVRDEFLGPAGYLEGIWVNKKTGEEVEGKMPDLDKPNPWKTWTYKEYRYRDTKHNIIGEDEFDITGAIDGIIEYKGEKMLLDIKTINQYWWNRLESISEVYQVQLMFYMYLTGFKKGAFLYVNKNTSEMKLFELEWDEEMFQKYLDLSVIKPQEMLLDNKISGRIEMCNNKNTTVAKGCDYCDICFEKETTDLNDIKEIIGIPC